MHREGDALVVIPSGALNTTSVSRLREIVETRRSRYPRILIDLRELTTTDPSGLTSLATWATETPWPPTISTLGDPRTLAAL
jgi:anti-anti-sigma regulatory factor